MIVYISRKKLPAVPSIARSRASWSCSVGEDAVGGAWLSRCGRRHIAHSLLRRGAGADGASVDAGASRSFSSISMLCADQRRQAVGAAQTKQQPPGTGFLGLEPFHLLSQFRKHLPSPQNPRRNPSSLMVV